MVWTMGGVGGDIRFAFSASEGKMAGSWHQNEKCGEGKMGEHAVVATGRDVFHSRAFAIGVAQSVVSVVLGGVALKIVAQFGKIYRDFEAPLPKMTEVVIGFHQLLSRYWYLAFLPVLAWPFVNYGVVSLLSPRPDVVMPRRLWYFATWGTILLVVMVAVFALFCPLVPLVEKK
jgi:hypothetical protein